MRTGLLATALAGLFCVLILTLPAERAESFANIEVDGVTLYADPEFLPRQLPRNRFAPARINAEARFDPGDAGLDKALQRMRINLGGRHVRIDTRGLPVCRPSALEETNVAQARQRCRGSIVGSGIVAARAERPDGSTLRGTSALTIFNGPRIGGRPSMVSHAYTAIPSPETFVVGSPLLVDKRGIGGFSIDVRMPEIADGTGYVTAIRSQIGRQWRHGRARRSYISARCPLSMLPASGRFEFGGDTVIQGTLFKFCDFRR